MTKMLLRFVHEFKDRHGKTRRYVRRPGFKRVPLPSDPGSPEFMEAYSNAIGPNANRVEPGAKRTAPGTVADLVVRYYKSKEFCDNLRPSTQSTYRSIIEPFRAEHGDKRVALLRRDHIKDMLAKKAATPTAANNFLKRLRQLMALAIDVGMRSDNPTIAIKPFKISSGGHPMWTKSDVAAFRRKHPHGSRARLAMEMGLCTMQRCGDLARMGRQHIQNGVLTIRQEKTGQVAPIPILPELQAEFDLLPAGQLTFLVTKHGKAFSSAGLGNWFGRMCRQAGLPDGYNTHGLRKAGATRGAEAGWTVHQIAAWGGWKSLSEVQRYTKDADRRKLALAAVHKLKGRTLSGKPE